MIGLEERIDGGRAVPAESALGKITGVEADSRGRVLIDQIFKQQIQVPPRSVANTPEPSRMLQAAMFLTGVLQTWGSERQSERRNERNSGR
jgi:hypothetical protein